MHTVTTHELRGVIAQLKSATTAADQNHDGVIDHAELREAIRQAGGTRAHVERELVLGQAFADAFELPKGGASLNAMRARLDGYTRAFEKADRNHNHCISDSEMVALRKGDASRRSFAASILWDSFAKR